MARRRCFSASASRRVVPCNGLASRRWMWASDCKSSKLSKRARKWRWLIHGMHPSGLLFLWGEWLGGEVFWILGWMMDMLFFNYIFFDFYVTDEIVMPNPGLLRVLHEGFFFGSGITFLGLYIYIYIYILILLCWKRKGFWSNRKSGSGTCEGFGF